MSYFLFGSLTTDSSPQNDDDLAWRVAAAATSARLYVLLGPNVHQPPVRDMLRSKDLFDDDHLSLLLTHSPLCDTSEELLGDYEYEMAKDLPPSARDTFNRVSEWIRHVFRIAEIRGIRLLMTEGFDDSFDEVQISVDQLTDTVMAKIEEEGEIPSLSIQIMPS